MSDINTEFQPSSVNQFWWLWEQNPEMMAKYDYGNECGKWMMFWNMGPQLDENWALARRLYKFILRIFIKLKIHKYNY